MDKYERRRLRLIELLHTKCGGKIVTLADKIDRNASLVSRMLYPADKKGSKHIGDNIRGTIEIAFSLPSYWLDQEAGTPEGQIQVTQVIRDFTTQHQDVDIRAVVALMEQLDLSGRSRARGMLEGAFFESLRKTQDEKRKAQNFIGRTGT